MSDEELIGSLGMQVDDLTETVNVLRGAVGQQTEQVRRWKNKCHTQRYRRKLAQNAIGEVLDGHEDDRGYCNECGGKYPCRTRRVLTSYRRRTNDEVPADV